MKSQKCWTWVKMTMICLMEYEDRYAEDLEESYLLSDISVKDYELKRTMHGLDDEDMR